MTHATTAKTTPNAIPISKPQNNITYVRDIPECSTAIMLMIVGVVKIVVEFVARKCLFDVRLNEIVVEILTLRGLDVGFGVTTLASEFPLNEVADVVEQCDPRPDEKAEDGEDQKEERVALDLDHCRIREVARLGKVPYQGESSRS